MSHTKGPWKYDGLVIYDDQHRVVAMTASQFRHLEEEEANNHLIAAAPELLEVLQEIMLIPNIEPDGQWFPNFDGIAFSRDSKMWKDVEAAIAKALGKGQ